MTFLEMGEVIKEVEYPDYDFVVGKSHTGYTYLQAFYMEPDTLTGESKPQYTRRWLLSPAMSKSEIVSTALKCVMTSMEHRVREWFLYRGKAIYQPHYDVDALYEICEERVMRAVQTS